MKKKYYSDSCMYSFRLERKDRDFLHIEARKRGMSASEYIVSSLRSEMPTYEEVCACRKTLDYLREQDIIPADKIDGIRMLVDNYCKHYSVLPIVDLDKSIDKFQREL